MGFIRKLFGGRQTSSNGGIYVYVRIHRTGEIVQLRLGVGYDISQRDEGGYFAHKIVMGKSSFERADATFYFDRNYKLEGTDIQGGEISTEDEYLRQQEDS